VGYADFCRLIQKGEVVTLTISEYTRPILIIFACDVATILPLNIFESELPYSYPFRNASLPNKGHFANFARNWLPWQRPLRNWSIIYEQKPIICYKDRENRSCGSWDNCLRAIIKKEEKQRKQNTASMPSGLNKDYQ